MFPGRMGRLAVLCSFVLYREADMWIYDTRFDWRWLWAFEAKRGLSPRELDDLFEMWNMGREL